jgi:hypothetical protein
VPANGGAGEEKRSNMTADGGVGGGAGRQRPSGEEDRRKGRTRDDQLRGTCRRN